jgi:fructokinase
VASVIVVAGEALIDLVGEPDGRYRPVPGGSPANVAVALARLGVPTELLARLGTGRFGRLVREHLEANGVGLSHSVQADEPATLAVVSLDETGRASYDFYVDGTADWRWSAHELPGRLPPGTVALCTGSLAVALEPGAAALVDLVRREAARGEASIVLDPNLRPALLGSRERAHERVESLVALAGIVKVSDEDLGWLAPGEAVEAVATRWLGLGPRLVVVTLGGRGAYAWSRAGMEVGVRARPVDLIDTVGAGDSFTAGLIDALHRRSALGNDAALDHLTVHDLRAVLEHAGLVAAITCSRRGADPPTAAELARAAVDAGLQAGRQDRHT